MRRVWVPVSLESPCQGPKKEGPIACKSLARWRLWGRGDSWGAIGSLEVPTAHPGGVRFPGAPLSFKIASIYP